ncbi:dolichyl-diphosphooligosaccharide--protein glycosyltransferase subunit DAD1-like isoform X2 [Convolutriloba macropyga]|uniref:dolichyl-diphosphooligosaccharide--protein glycosyltransferase subunit DAD1-like isoform X1 n=1 Tax=Convolutriloba macropyga TaxID=536237 RepID=UPI003F521941
MSATLKQAVVSMWTEYDRSTSTKLKLVDCFLGYIMATGIIQFIYQLIVGSFPFNSFLAGFISTVATFILTVSLRIQINPENKKQFEVTPERAFADYVFAQVILHLVVMNFIG